MINEILKEQLPEFKFVTACFAGSKTAYTYKTTLDLKAGDLVVVEAPSGLTVITLVEADVDFKDTGKFPIKWIVDVVDTTTYFANTRLETELTLAAKADVVDHIVVERL